MEVSGVPNLDSESEANIAGLQAFTSTNKPKTTAIRNEFFIRVKFFYKLKLECINSVLIYRFVLFVDRQN